MVTATVALEVCPLPAPPGAATGPHPQTPHSAAACFPVSRLYVVMGSRLPEMLRTVMERLCVDPLLVVSRDADSPDNAPGWIVDLLPLPGVTDAEGDSLAAALAAAGCGTVQARSGRRFRLPAALSAAEAHQLAGQLANPVVEQARLFRHDDLPPDPWTGVFMPAAGTNDRVETIPLRELDDAALLALSRARLLALPLADLQAVRHHFLTIDRDPTDVELETIAQTWSEHCAHRTFKATIRHCEPDTPEIVIEGLLNTFVVTATEKVARPWVRSAFKDNAGIVAFDRKHDLSFKVETHNHPSAIEPFGGANTGVGGVVRDILGVSAEPIANTDVLCFGPLDLSSTELPPGTLPPPRIVEGVVAGIADYGNKMGIPTVNGAVLFDPGYVANPLVFCGTVGLAPCDANPPRPRVGDLVVTAGGRVGRDGIHGATFSSEVITGETTAQLGSVVQIGDPIVEKRLADALPQVRDEGLYTAITDCGAGGLSSAVGEMASELGADIDLAEVPLKYAGLRPWEIWLSEAQERLVFAVPSDKWPAFAAMMAAEGVETTAIGRFTGDGQLVVRYATGTVANLDCRFLFAGMPLRNLRSVWPGPPQAEPIATGGAVGPDLTHWLELALADPNVASKEAIVRRFDHEVQGHTIGKPFVGPLDIGPSDAAVLRPVPDSRRGVAVGCGINPRFGMIDPYAMAMLAIDEALRNVVAVGADPNRTAILDNFCWGDPTKPDRLGGLVRAARGCHDAAVGFRVPFISGKDSLFNEYVDADGVARSIPGTLLISAIGIVPDVRRVVSMELKQPGNLVFLVGITGDDLGGSLFRKLQGRLGHSAPPLKLRVARAVLNALHRAMRAGLVRACHDLSEGGLAVASAEMALASPWGLALARRSDDAAASCLSDEAWLFAESPTRFLVEVAPEDADAFERALGRRPCHRIGIVTDEPRLRIEGATSVAIDAPVDHLRHIWRQPLAGGMG